jgi:D-alanyl-D-alanine carboxypeptidase
MTLYLLFERLDAGKIKLDSPLKISEHAAAQAPTKLGLKAGQTVTVEDAIKGIVTRSANDAAVTIAENLGGDEDEFAKLMTQKAQALGMSHTTYVNASGLPDDDQITSARDQALLGRAIQNRFPRYYKYFSTPSFVFHGETIRTHDHLLGSVEGVDGIKTGFTLASGFNLVTSVHRDGRYIVGVVLGGRSAGARDAQMRELIGEHIKEAAIHRSAPVVAEQAEHRDEPRAVETALASTPRSDAGPIAMPGARVAAAAGTDDPIRPVLVKTTTYRIAPVPTAPLAPMPALVPVAAPAAPPAALQPVAQAAAAEAIAPAQPAPAPPVASPRPVVVASADAVAPVTTASTKAEPVSAVPPRGEPARARGGWLIQIGAYGGEDEAKQHLSAAQLKVHATLAAADPFTERVQKGDKAFYRARFAGFDKDTAEAACRQLKHNDIECMALKD